MKLKLLLALTIFCFGFFNLKASHMMGGDITYECISPGKYKLVIKIYRDCRGISFNNPSISVFCKNGTNNVNVNYTRTAINDISERCPTDPAPCNPTNTPTGAGIEEHVFEAIVDFNTAPFKAIKDANCCEVMIKVEQNARNGAITTINPGNFYTDAMIDICKIGDKCNTSPQISIPPVAYLCCNQPFTYNNGVREIVDGDSLSFELTTPLNANNSNENYTGQFNSQFPMTPYCPPNPGKLDCKPIPNARPPRGFYFDKETGDIIFTPTKCDEVGVIVIMIKEWRKNANYEWELIGYTKRDMQLIVRQCPDNNPPEFKGGNKFSICEGEKICFNVITEDRPFLPKQTVPDTVELTWNYGIPGATFVITNPTDREKIAQFCWQTKIGDARPNAYSFTATAKDNNCQSPSQANRGYLVAVKPKALSTRTYEILDCGWLRWTAYPVDTIAQKANYYSYQFTIRDSTNSGVPLYMNYAKRDSFKFKRGGKYIIEHRVNNSQFNCPTIYQDTVIMPPVLDVELSFGKDTFVCAGDSLTLEPTVTNGVPNYKYAWESPLGTKNAKDTFRKFTIKPTMSTKIVLALTDKNKCIDRDTIFVLYQPNPKVNIGPDRRICTYDSVILDAQNDDTMRYYWQPNGDSTRTIKINVAGRYIAKVIDHLGCNTSDTMNLFVNDTVVAIAKPDREICIKDTLKVTGKRRPLGYAKTVVWKDLNTGGTISNDSAFQAVITTMTTRKYEMFLKINQGNVVCEDRDTFTLTVNALPTFTFKGFKPHCFADGAINLTLNSIAVAKSGDGSVTQGDIRYFQKFKKPSWVTGGPVGVNTYVYDYPKFITNDQVPKTGLKDTICYEYKDYKGCYFHECKPVSLNANPTVELKTGTFCQKAGLINLDKLVLKPFSKVGGIQTFRCIEVPQGSGVDETSIVWEDFTTFPTKWVMDPGQEGENQKTGDYQVEYCFRDAATSCQSCDTTTVTVVKLPEIQFESLPKQCINNPLLELDSFVRDRNTGKRFNDGFWQTVEFAGSRNMNNPTTANKILNSIKDQKRFDPSYGPGQFLLKLTDTSSGCPVSDSTEILVNGLPIIQIDVPDTVCSSSAPFTLNNKVPAGAVGTWSGPGVVGRDFDPSISPITQQYEGKYMLKFAYTNPLTGCSASDSQSLLIQSQPTIDITNDKQPYQQCEGIPFAMKSEKEWAQKVLWTTDGDGSFNGTQSVLNSTYTHGIQDTALTGKNGDVKLTVSTVKEGVCPVATKDILLKIEPYPQFDFTADEPIQCEPAKVNFAALVTKPNGSTQLRYTWYFGNGDSVYKSTNPIPPVVTYDTANRNWYNVRLEIDNQWGTNEEDKCTIVRDSISYIKILPQPVALFSSDPGFFTTVAFPKFKFQNETKWRWETPGVVDYLWQFNYGDEDDTSTQKHPIHTYPADTMNYWVHLTSKYTFTDINNVEHVCWDTIGQARRIGPDVTVFVPTAFSPEGTGPARNNVFLPIVNGEKTYHVELYNRWGEKLWETDNKFESWDGMYSGVKAQQDVYAWLIIVTAYDGEEYKYEGTVTLLR
jgi:hypothetical protein